MRGAPIALPAPAALRPRRTHSLFPSIALAFLQTFEDHFWCPASTGRTRESGILVDWLFRQVHRGVVIPFKVHGSTTVAVTAPAARGYGGDRGILVVAQSRSSQLHVVLLFTRIERFWVTRTTGCWPGINGDRSWIGLRIQIQFG